MLIGRIYRAAILGALLQPGAAFASDRLDFFRCDGNVEPHGSDDGFYGKSYDGSTFGTDGDRACDAALADPTLLPAMGARRAHLYQAKALNRLALDDVAGALAQLDRSDALLASLNDVWASESIGVGNRMVRAYVLFQSGRASEARAMLDAAVADRPYSSLVARSVRSLATTFDNDLATKTRLLMRDAILSPDLIGTLFWLSFFHGDYVEAERLGRQITYAEPASHGGWEIEGGATANGRRKEQTDVAGALAYALLAMGRRDEARKMIADTRAGLVGVTGSPLSSRKLDDWERAMNLRDQAAGMSYAAFDATMRDPHNSRLVPLADLVRQVRPTNDTDRAAIAAALARIDVAARSVERPAAVTTIAGLAATLPDPDRRASRPKLRNVRGRFFRTDDGFAIDADATSGQAMIRFGHSRASEAAVAEAALVEAALYSQGQGKDAFIVNWSASIPRTKTIVYVSGEIDSGFETQLNIRPVSSTTLPPELEPQRWRIVRVDAVLAKLGAKYLTDGASH